MTDDINVLDKKVKNQNDLMRIIKREREKLGLNSKPWRQIRVSPDRKRLGSADDLPNYKAEDVAKLKM